MLDRYWFGDAHKLSQEAPVPVVRMNHEERRPGAAANVAMNCLAMGSETSLACSIGDDEYGRALIALLDGVEVDYRVGQFRTTQKLRIIARQQQIARIDFEDDGQQEVTPSAAHSSADIVVVSDYGKGALANVRALIDKYKSHGKLVFVDPKGHDYEKYRGADLVKPNIDEMKELVGGWSSEQELTDKAYRLIRNGGFGAILLTRSSHGMTLFVDGECVHLPAQAKDVYDVSGAGDTAIAAFAVAIDMGRSLVDAAKYANKAAGIVVGRFGTAIASKDEVFND